MEIVPAHDQNVTHRYVVHYPEHSERESDPTYKLFHAYRKRTKPTAQCQFGVQRGSFTECTLDLPLELHHSVMEFALAGAVDTAEEWEWFEADFPCIDTRQELSEFVNGDERNFMWLCQYHHRGAGGIHVLSAADWSASQYIHKMTSKLEK
jgi:hypothetical protein